MHNTIFDTICRAVLIGVMLLIPTAVKAAPPDVSDAEDKSAQRTNPCVYEFWNLAWDLDFVLGQSGMLLEDSGTETWQVLVIDTEAEDYVVAEGSFTEADRLLLESMAPTQEELDEAGIISFDHYIVAGSITGSTVFQSAVFGFAMEVVVPGLEPGDDPILSHGFTPLALADDVTLAVAMAHDYWAAFEFPYLFLDIVSLSLPTWESHDSSSRAMAGDRDCAEEERLCKQGAHLRHLARMKEINADAIAGFRDCALVSAVCAFGGPMGYAACLSGCGATVVARQSIRLSASKDQRDADKLDCERERAVCEAE